VSYVAHAPPWSVIDDDRRQKAKRYCLHTLWAVTTQQASSFFFFKKRKKKKKKKRKKKILHILLRFDAKELIP